MPVAPVIALSHGGGPLPVLGDKNHESIVASLRTRVPQILGTPSAPRAIVVVTAHWSTAVPTASSTTTYVRRLPARRLRAALPGARRPHARPRDPGAPVRRRPALGAGPPPPSTPSAPLRPSGTPPWLLLRPPPAESIAGPAWRPGGRCRMRIASMHPPREGEHFLPLLVCAGAAGDGEQARLYKDVWCFWAWIL